MDSTRGPDMRTLLQRVPSTAPAVVIAGSGDDDAILSLVGLSPHLGELTTVLLEGFAPNDESGARRQLESAGVRTITCAPGQLEEAIAALEGVREPVTASG
jgi:hypothetical protein